MPSKKTLIETAEAYRQGWKKCREDNAELHAATVRRMESLESTVEAQKDYILSSERKMREHEDTIDNMSKVIAYLRMAIESEADVAEDTARAMRAKLAFAEQDLHGIPLPFSTGPVEDSL